MTLRKGLTTLVFFGIGLGLFWLAMQGVEDPEALKRDMRSAQWWGIAASFVMGYLAIVLAACAGTSCSPPWATIRLPREVFTPWPSPISPMPLCLVLARWRGVRP